MKKQAALLFFILSIVYSSWAQDYFSIALYKVNVRINKDATLDIDETIDIHFTQERHGIVRRIPIRFAVQQLPSEVDKLLWEMEPGTFLNTTISMVDVSKREFLVRTEGDFKVVRIGSANKFVNGDQQYKIHYRVLNAIMFFENHAELCLNIIGDGWPTTIDKVSYRVELPDSLPGIPDYFVSTGLTGSTTKSTIGMWQGTNVLYGSTPQKLSAKEGVTVGIKFPKEFLTK